jgi:hypothetical protein
MDSPIDSLPVHGQGVFLFRAPYSTTVPATVRITIKNTLLGLEVKFTDKAVTVTRVGTGEVLTDPKNTSGLVSHPGAYYWFSLDSQNQRLFAGVGEARTSTAVYTYQWNLEGDARETNKIFLESLKTVFYSNNVSPMRVLRDPITLRVPMLVKRIDSLTMSDIARGDVLPSANLSTMAQKLYDCVAGEQFVLDAPDFPDFSRAIEHSIATPGCWCNTRLKEKSREFNKDKPNEAETYLRITLGENNGESPGIPYVMEIWPVGHYSPIHNHGGSEAVIRVLHGSINVSLFPYLCADKDGVPPFEVADFKKEDITWISPTLNQVHQLRNLPTNKDTCITIQCYMYNEKNQVHYDYFDYLDDNGKRLQYEPDSDMDFLKFKETMRREWDELHGRRRRRTRKERVWWQCWA